MGELDVIKVLDSSADADAAGSRSTPQHVRITSSKEEPMDEDLWGTPESFEKPQQKYHREIWKFILTPKVLKLTFENLSFRFSNELCVDISASIVNLAEICYT